MSSTPHSDHHQRKGELFHGSEFFSELNVIKIPHSKAQNHPHANSSMDHMPPCPLGRQHRLEVLLDLLLSRERPRDPWRRGSPTLWVSPVFSLSPFHWSQLLSIGPYYFYFTTWPFRGPQDDPDLQKQERRNKMGVLAATDNSFFLLVYLLTHVYHWL